MHFFQVPAITNYTMVNRTYRYFEGVPLYPFGYGLYVHVHISHILYIIPHLFIRSYSKFTYSDLVVSPSSIKPGDNVTVKVTVKNIGSRDGDEVGVVMMS